MDRFNHIFLEFMKHAETSSKDLRPPLKLILKQYFRRGPICKDDDNEDISLRDIKHMSSITEIMDIFASYCSFFNFELLERAIVTVNYTHGIELMEEYKKGFAIYTSRRLVDCPYGVGMVGDYHTCVKIWLDEAYSTCKMEHLYKLRNDFSKILHIDPEHIQFEGIVMGSICVIFHIFMSMKNTVFPLNDEQVSDLRKWHYFNVRVMKLVCDEYTYNFEAPPPSKFY